MVQFAEELNHQMPIVASGRRVVDASGIEGGWDLTFTTTDTARRFCTHCPIVGPSESEADIVKSFPPTIVTVTRWVSMISNA
jgi:hypothetical protein